MQRKCVKRKSKDSVYCKWAINAFTNSTSVFLNLEETLFIDFLYSFNIKVEKVKEQSE